MPGNPISIPHNNSIYYLLCTSQEIDSEPSDFFTKIEMAELRIALISPVLKPGIFTSFVFPNNDNVIFRFKFQFIL